MLSFTWIEYYYNRTKGEKALTSPFAAAYQLSCFVTGEAIDPECGIYGGIEISQTSRQKVKESFGDGKAGQLAGIVYDGTMSLADYGTASVTTGGNGWALLAMEGYAETGQQAAIRGLDPNAIQLEGLATAIGDILMDRTVGSAFKGGGFLKDVGSGWATNAGGGMFNRAVDRLVAGELS